MNNAVCVFIASVVACDLVVAMSPNFCLALGHMMTVNAIYYNGAYQLEHTH